MTLPILLIQLLCSICIIVLDRFLKIILNLGELQRHFDHYRF